jgi:hypothetical protein
MDLVRLYRDIPAEILPNELLQRRGRLGYDGGYVVCSGATDGKTHTSMWLMKKVNTLPDETRPRGFMVTRDERKEDEAYASFVARSLRVNRKIDPARTVHRIAAALSCGTTPARIPTIAHELKITVLFCNAIIRLYIRCFVHMQSYRRSLLADLQLLVELVGVVLINWPKKLGERRRLRFRIFLEDCPSERLLFRSRAISGASL